MQNRIVSEVREVLKKRDEEIAPRPWSLPPANLTKRLESVCNCLREAALSVGCSVEVTDEYTSAQNDRPVDADYARSGYALAELIWQTVALAVSLGFGIEGHANPHHDGIFNGKSVKVTGGEVSGPIPCLLENLLNTITHCRREGRGVHHRDILKATEGFQ